TEAPRARTMADKKKRLGRFFLAINALVLGYDDGHERPNRHRHPAGSLGAPAGRERPRLRRLLPLPRHRPPPFPARVLPGVLRRNYGERGTNLHRGKPVAVGRALPGMG